MLYGKCVLNEDLSTNKETLTKFNRGVTTLTLVETPLSLISQSSMDGNALVLLCMKFNDTEANMIKILSTFKNVCNNILIVLTYANANVSGEPLGEVVERQTSVIKRILKEKNCMNKQFLDSLKVVPASYHTEVIIKDDPLNKPWITNLWFQAIASAKPASQAVLILLVNYHIYNKKSLPRKLADYKESYIHDLTAILHEIILTQKLDLGFDFKV